MSKFKMIVISHYIFIALCMLTINVWAEVPPTIDVHFVVITNNPQAKSMTTQERLRREVVILNRYFRSDLGKPLVTFRFKSSHRYDEVKDLDCYIVKEANEENYNGSKWNKNFNNCTHKKVRDPNAINFYIYDSHDGNCHGRRNSNRPYIFFHYKRLNHTGGSPEEHEMGHCFGLGHECSYGLHANDKSNIMTSIGYLCPKHKGDTDPKRSGAKRNTGFYSKYYSKRCEPEDKRTKGKSQVEVIKHHTNITLHRLKNDTLRINKNNQALQQNR